jgi:hypothetical protein
MPPKKRRKVTPTELIVRLKETCLILPTLRLLEVTNVQFIQNNGSNLSYLYYVTELILGCPVKLSRQMDGQDAPDDDAGWKLMSPEEGILFGVYLVDCEYGGKLPR